MALLSFHPTKSLAALASLALATLAWAQAPATPEEDIRGPRPLIEIPAPAASPVPLWTAITTGAIALTAAAFLFRRLSRKTTAPLPPEIAMAALDHLAATRESLSADAFANQAASTLRDYIAARFGLAAPRRTTEEFLRDLAGGTDSPLSSFGDSLRAFLLACDLAKFAGAGLNLKQRDELLGSARAFIQATAATAEPHPKAPSP